MTAQASGINRPWLFFAAPLQANHTSNAMLTSPSLDNVSTIIRHGFYRISLEEFIQPHNKLTLYETHTTVNNLSKLFQQQYDTNTQQFGRYFWIDSSHKPHNASDKYPIMPQFATEMCTHVHISIAKWCIVEYGTGASSIFALGLIPSSMGKVLFIIIESIKTMSMEDVSTRVLEKINNI